MPPNVVQDVKIGARDNAGQEFPALDVAEGDLDDGTAASNPAISHALGVLEALNLAEVAGDDHLVEVRQLRP